MALTTISKDKLLNKAKKHSATIIILIVAFIFVFFGAATLFSYQTMQGGSSALADQALQEYQYWQSHNLSETPYSCQGQKYCNHFNTGVDEWCAYFVGYCADTVGINLSEVKWSAACTPWVSELKSLSKYKTAGTYTPQRGNVIFFDYGGRAHHNMTGNADHVGIVVEINDENTITIVCGNESGADCTSSHINKYQISLSSDSICGYGCIGTDVAVLPNSLNSAVREIICKNETGTLYSSASSEFGTVEPNDNGALSIGVFCWHGNNAYELIKTAYRKNTLQVTRILNSHGSAGNYVKRAILNGADWDSYIPDYSVSSCLKAILLSDAGKAAQDEKSLSYAQSYIDKCKEKGLKSPKCIMYCSDILNQYGLYSFDGGVLSEVTNSWSLDQIYNSQIAWSDSNYNYYGRRTWTYNYIKSL